MTTINSFDDESVRLISEQVIRMKNQIENLERQVQTAFMAGAKGARIYTGICKRRAGEGYPTSGCTVPVEITDLEQTIVLGTCSDLNQYPTTQFELCQSLNGVIPPEGWPVHILLTYAPTAMYWLLPPGPELATADNDINAGASGLFTRVDVAGSPDTTYPVTAYNLTTKTLKAGVLHGIWPAKGGFFAFPIQLADCNQAAAAQAFPLTVGEAPK